MNRLFFLLFPSLFIACKPDVSKTEETHTQAADTTAVTTVSIPGLKHLWDTDMSLTTSESVVYDKTNNLLYVSCINGFSPDRRDKDGFISKVGMDGKIPAHRWVTGLNDPKGMSLAGNTLYVTDIDRLVAIDIPSGKISGEWKVEGAISLNDVHALEDGTVYFTDSGKSTVHKLSDDKVTVVHSDASLNVTNGILVEGHAIYLAGATSGDLYRMDVSTKTVQSMAQGIPGGDGIARYGEGLLVSNWNGEIYYVSSTGEVTEILDTQEAKLNAADIEVVAGLNLLLVPTFYGNSLTAYELLKN